MPADPGPTEETQSPTTAAPAPEARPPWWRGARGEWYVAAQVALIGLVFLGPRSWPGLPAWPAPLLPVFRAAGAVLMAGGAALLLAGLFRLGPNLTPLPYPKDGARLIVTGPYALVRHPMYAGGVVLAFGWAILVHGWLTLAYATVLFVFLDLKSSREERWLMAKFPEYAGYRRRVKKLVPFVH